jgi:hypothetical protein
MIHIRQIGSSFNPNEAYTVVDTRNYMGDLEHHPCLIDYPNEFELVDCEIPNHFQYLNYTG